DRVHHAMDELLDAGFSFRSAQLAVEIFAGDDVSRRLRPEPGRLDVPLLEDHCPFVITDRGCAALPLDLIIRRSAFGQMRSEIAGENHTLLLPLSGGCPTSRVRQFRAWIHGDLFHQMSLPVMKSSLRSVRRTSYNILGSCQEL